MSDTPMRKTLSLKKRPEQEVLNRSVHQAPASSQDKNKRSPAQKTIRQDEAQAAFLSLTETDGELDRLHRLRLSILAKITLLEQRLQFATSEPLVEACNELKRQDLALLCQINSCLLRL